MRLENNTKINIAPSVDKGHILIKILVTLLHLQTAKNDIWQMALVEHV